MKKVLIVTTVSGFVPQFEMNNVVILQKMGYEVHYASNFKMPVYFYKEDIFQEQQIKQHQVDFVRSPFRIEKNLKAYRQLCKLLEEDDYQLVHCHTPMGGVLARISLIRTRKEIPVIYTAHGFHFYKDAGWINWLLFYPLEKFLAKYTDILITINSEDFERASGFKLKKNGSVEKINGVGVAVGDMSAENETERSICCREKRAELGIRQDSFLLVSVGELSTRKNQQVIIDALGKVENVNLQYLICGSGALEEQLRKRVQVRHLQEKVIFAGYREDVTDILKAGDCFVFPSRQEGLPLALMEAMEQKLPVICSDIRGNHDLITEDGGRLIAVNDILGYAEAISELYRMDKADLHKMGERNKERVQMFSKDVVGEQMSRIYAGILNQQEEA